MTSSPTRVATPAAWENVVPGTWTPPAVYPPPVARSEMFASTVFVVTGETFVSATNRESEPSAWTLLPRSCTKQSNFWKVATEVLYLAPGLDSGYWGGRALRDRVARRGPHPGQRHRDAARSPDGQVPGRAGRQGSPRGLALARGPRRASATRRHRGRPSDP